MTTYNFLSKEPVYPYHYTPPPPRIRLMAWVHETGNECAYYAEIQDASAEKQTAWVCTPGRKWMHPVPFTALESVALCEGNKVIQAFGRPYIGPKPEWVQFAEAV